MKPLPSRKTLAHLIIGLVIWFIGWCILLLLETHMGLTNLGLLLILTSVIASLWLNLRESLLCSLIGFAAFNWQFIPPVGAFAINIQEDLILFVVMLLVNAIISILMSLLRDQSQKAQLQASRSENLRRWVERLRDASQPEDLLEDLYNQLTSIVKSDIYLVAEGYQYGVQPDKEQQDALLYCWEVGQMIGAGTGRYQELVEIYLPLRSHQLTVGAVMFKEKVEKKYLIEAQALCDQMALALERNKIQKEQQIAHDQAKMHKLRSTFLAAISHDYRTPLASILSAASSIEQQDINLDNLQRQRLAQSITGEAERLLRLTTNILQLARLDATGGQLQLDWVSAEEIAGSVLHRIRKQGYGSRLKTTLSPRVPLLWGDHLLLSQLLENLLDNAFKYSSESPVLFQFYADETNVVFVVADQGPGIPENEMARLFDIFQRGDRTNGTGVGLAFCKAVAEAHKGDLHVFSSNKGCYFECRIPIKSQPDF
jgi:two-component system, OmpR family, sensor histidine kinase KdpD